MDLIVQQCFDGAKVRIISESSKYSAKFSCFFLSVPSWAAFVVSFPLCRNNSENISPKYLESAEICRIFAIANKKQKFNNLKFMISGTDLLPLHAGI